MDKKYFRVPITNRKIVFARHGFLVDSYELDETVNDWLIANCKSAWYMDWVDGKHVSFLEERDALLFKLTWGGA